MEKLLLCTAFGCIDACLCIDLFSCFFRKRSERVSFRIAVVFTYTVMFALNFSIVHTLLDESIWLSYEVIFFQVIFGMVLCFVGFNGKILEMVIMYTIFYICEVLADSFYIIFISVLDKRHLGINMHQEFIIMAIQKFLTFLISKSYQKVFSRKDRKIEGKIFFSMLILPVITISVCVYLNQMELANDRDRIFLGAAIPLLIFCNVIVFIVVEKVSRLQYEHHELDILKQKIEMERIYYNRLDEIEQKQVAVRHDIKHYISVLRALNSEKKFAEMEKLFNQFEDGMNRITPEKYTKNRILNALLSEKKSNAAKDEVTVEYMIEPNIDVDMLSDIDIISLFGNLIDNAIRAEKESGSVIKKINVNLFEAEGNFNVLNVRNRFDHVEKKGNDFISTKKEGVHGIGLKNVERIAKKYGGVFTVEIEENGSEKVFDATVCFAKK